MALLLDDDELCEVTYVPPAKLEKSEHHATTSAAELGGTSPAQAASGRTPQASFSLKGGDGLSKMAALAFGAPPVRVTAGTTHTPSARKRPAPGAAPAAPQSAESSPAAKVASVPAVAVDGASPSATSPVTCGTPENQRQGSGAASSSEKSASTARALALPASAETPQGSTTKQTPAASVKSSTPATITQSAPPKQMNLSDFFAKMACKKKE